MIEHVRKYFPRDAVLLNYERAHGLLIDPGVLQSEETKDLTTWLDRLDAQAGAGPSITWVQNGRVICCFGLCVIYPSVVEVWLYRQGELLNQKRAFAVAAWHFVRVAPPILEAKRAQMTVDCKNISALRFAKWLKFEVEGVLKSFGTTDIAICGRLYEQIN